VTVLAAVLLAACATQPRYDNRYDARYNNGRAYRSGCDNCGTIERIERVRLRNQHQSIGTGAVLGAIIGGVAGNKIASEDDRKVGTAAGAVAGGVIGHQIQKNNGKQKRGYQFDVQLDDGRVAQVTQLEKRDLRVGNRVLIRDHRVELLR
jgi:outer membrane lipoprotein SlyB